MGRQLVNPCAIGTPLLTIRAIEGEQTQKAAPMERQRPGQTVWLRGRSPGRGADTKAGPNRSRQANGPALCWGRSPWRGPASGTREGKGNFEAMYLDAYGREKPCFSLPPREVKILITGYDVVRRAKVIDRLGIPPAQFSAGYTDQQGKPRACFSLPPCMGYQTQFAGGWQHRRAMRRFACLLSG